MLITGGWPTCQDRFLVWALAGEHLSSAVEAGARLTFAVPERSFRMPKASESGVK